MPYLQIAERLRRLAFTIAYTPSIRRIETGGETAWIAIC
jgi:hypothetical protein